MSKTLLANLVAASLQVGSAETVPPTTIVCEPATTRLAQVVCTTERLLARDREVGLLAVLILESDLEPARLDELGRTSDRLRARRDACVTRRGTDPAGVESCLIFAYDRWIEMLRENAPVVSEQDAPDPQVQPADAPSLFTPVSPPDLQAR